MKMAAHVNINAHRAGVDVDCLHQRHPTSFCLLFKVFFDFLPQLVCKLRYRRELWDLCLVFGLVCWPVEEGVLIPSIVELALYLCWIHSVFRKQVLEVHTVCEWVVCLKHCGCVSPFAHLQKGKAARVGES